MQILAGEGCFVQTEMSEFCAPYLAENRNYSCAARRVQVQNVEKSYHSLDKVKMSSGVKFHFFFANS